MKKREAVRERVHVKGLMMHQSNGRSGLKFVCQLCGEFIEDAELGLLIWNPSGREVLAAHKSCNARDGDRFEFTQELGTGLMYLLGNSGIRDHAEYTRWQGIAMSLAG